ncbi:MAG: DNA helicase [Pseudomonadota bacterium]
MKLSIPLYRLKRQAKVLARSEGIPHHQALDRIAKAQGFGKWSLLAKWERDRGPSQRLIDWLVPGDLLLLGGRPGQGKTLLSLEMIVEGVKRGKPGRFFTLDYNEEDVLEAFQSVAGQRTLQSSLYGFDNSDLIHSDYIADKLVDARPGTIVVIDYLQILDQRRANPDLESQVRDLKVFARERGITMIFISQIDRAFERTAKRCPTLEDVRLPNPLNLSYFNKACFVHDGLVQTEAVHT